MLTEQRILDMVKDSVGQLRAEIYGEERAKAREAADEPENKAAAMASAANSNEAGAVSTLRRGFRKFDPLADKDPADMTSMERARMFARCLQVTTQAKLEGTGRAGAIQIAKNHGQETLAKAMSASDFDDGGFMLEPAFADGIIEELAARSVYVRAGPETLELPPGGLVLPYESDGADAQWSGEGVEVNAEEIKGGQINLQPRELITVVGVSNRLLRARPGTSDTFIVNSILRGMRTKLDSTLLRSVGAQNEPKGLFALVDSGNVDTATTIGSLTEVLLLAELLRLQTFVENGNVDLAVDRPFYFMSPRTKNYLRAQRSTDGRLFPEMDERAGGVSGTLLGAGYDATSNIPNNLGGASDSEIYFVALAHMILGESQDMMVDTFPGGTYRTSAGTLKSGLSANETPVRVVSEWDHAAGQRGTEIARLDEVDWT